MFFFFPRFNANLSQYFVALFKNSAKTEFSRFKPWILLGDEDDYNKWNVNFITAKNNSHLYIFKYVILVPLHYSLASLIA
jgi:hypothetical protein